MCGVAVGAKSSPHGQVMKEGEKRQVFHILLVAMILLAYILTLGPILKGSTTFQ